MASDFTTVIWDMDGVLIDSENHWDSLETHFLEDAVDNWDDFDKSRMIGRSLKDIYNLLEKEHGIHLSYREYVEEFNALARRVYQEAAELSPNAEATLLRIREMGLQQALVSSSSRQWIRYALERFPLEEYFDSIISSDDVQGRGKPDPAIYEFACRQLECVKEKTLVVEDSRAGIAAAHKAGLTVIGYFPEKKPRGNPDGKITDLAEVWNMLSSSG